MNPNSAPPKRDRSPTQEADGNPSKRPNVNSLPPPGLACPQRLEDLSFVNDLKAKTVVELRNFAKAQNIRLKSGSRRADIVAKILEVYYSKDGRFSPVTPNLDVQQAPVVVNAPNVADQQAPVVVTAPEAVVQGAPAVQTVPNVVVKETRASFLARAVQATAGPYPFLNVAAHTALLRATPMVTTSVEDLVQAARSALREHIGVKEDGSEADPRKPALFFVELVPRKRGRKEFCCCPGCPEVYVAEGAYSIVVMPGIWNDMFNCEAQYYHVRCFEQLADFSQAAYLDRLVPVTRNTVLMRRVLSSSSALKAFGTRYLLDGGAERLVLKWKSLMQLLIEQNGGTHLGIKPTPEMEDLLHKAGSALYEPEEDLFEEDTLPGHEFKTLLKDLAPIQNDKPYTYKEWNLFKEYIERDLNNNLDNLKQPHILSSILGKWARHRHLATADDLDVKARAEKSDLGDLAIRAITRLAKVPPIAPEDEWSGRELREMVLYDGDMRDDSFGKRASSRMIAQALRGETWTLDYEEKQMEDAYNLMAELRLDDETMSQGEKDAKKIEIEERLAKEAGLPYEMWKPLYLDEPESGRGWSEMDCDADGMPFGMKRR